MKCKVYKIRFQRYDDYKIKVIEEGSFILKGVFAKNERGYRLNAIKKRF